MYLSPPVLVSLATSLKNRYDFLIYIAFSTSLTVVRSEMDVFLKGGNSE